MCGIAGLVSSQPLSEDDRFVVRDMTHRLAHRGPDGQGFWIDDRAALGHRRLTVIDLETGDQPMTNEDGSVVAVVNGEIYNHVELRRRLEANGHRFRTRSDAEPIVHLHEQTGPACLTELRGMFALAVWDANTRTLTLARDPLGIKPLYWTQIDHRLLFASTLTALLEHPDVPRAVDAVAVLDYLTFHYVPSPRTILKRVFKLPAAHRLIWTNGSVRVERYWDVSFNPDSRRADDAWFDELRGRIKASVRAHMIADVPVGAFLSGGLDSSTVTSLMTRASRDPVQTFTVAFDERAFDERREAHQLAQRLQTRHIEETLLPDPLTIVDTLVDCFDEPFADPSAIATRCISEIAAQHVKVVLSGDGGDELFGGYTRYVSSRARGRVRGALAATGLQPFADALSGRLGGRVRSLTANLAASPEHAHYLDVAWFDPRDTRRLLHPDWNNTVRDHDPFNVLDEHFQRCDAADPLARSQYVDLNTWLPDGVLCKVDRTSMAVGLEVRVPLLDIPLVESAARLPTRLKTRGRVGKWALRQAMESVLGPDVTRRGKRGFEVPLDDWFRGPLRSLVCDRLLDARSSVAQFIDPIQIAHIWNRLSRGQRGLGARLWALLMLDEWLKRWPAVSTGSREAIRTGAVPTTAAAAP